MSTKTEHWPIQLQNGGASSMLAAFDCQSEAISRRGQEPVTNPWHRRARRR